MRPHDPDVSFWLIDSIDVHRWYYRDAPEVGSMIRYMNETYIDHVERVTPLCVWLASGRAMIRPYIAGRLLAWAITATRAPRPRYSRGSSKTPTRSTPRLRPDTTILAA